MSTCPSTAIFHPFRPDYAHIQTPLMWGGIWQAPGLDLKLRSFATISAQCVNGWDFGLQHQIRVGLTMGMTPRQIKGIFIQLLFYAGIPATVHGLLQAQTVINERDEWKAADVSPEADWLDTLEAKLERGSEIRRELWGPEANREVEESLAQRMTPEASDIVDGYNYGEVWARDDLAPKERMVCVLAALMARGHWKQLRRYIRNALNMDSSNGRSARCSRRRAGTGDGLTWRTRWTGAGSVRGTGFLNRIGQTGRTMA